MATSTRRKSNSSHDRSALIQWLALGLILALGLVAVLVFTDGDGAPVQSGFLLNPVTA